ncbi:hypothetical protein GCM10010430_05920 [Kitasatospora cystarginea]|uniref:Uncharacterized protein n=1 Tax=Kitasatospora cystarginea TaxID=58350 RepID=A0ABN3DEE9_9ACTN
MPKRAREALAVAGQRRFPFTMDQGLWTSWLCRGQVGQVGCGDPLGRATAWIGSDLARVKFELDL